MTRTELLKIAKPILFNTEMVKAILDGRKTVTRRVVKPSSKRYFIDKTLSGKPAEFQMISIDEAKFIRMAKPQYKVGDYLYVRETWCEVPYECEHIPIKDGYIVIPKIAYKADSSTDYTGIWRPSIHMPKSAARIFLKVTDDVRVERLQDITEEQARAEGCYYGALFEGGNDDEIMARTKFIRLWNSTIKKVDLDKYGWNANPWVWAYEFERVECDEVN